MKIVKLDVIFEYSTAASGILTNDLLKIMEHSNSLGFSAEPVDDNIYVWNVRIFGFSPNSTIYNQLKQLKNIFGYDYVELIVNFTIDLHPFYPPHIKLIRPRYYLHNIIHIITIYILSM